MVAGLLPILLTVGLLSGTASLMQAAHGPKLPVAAGLVVGGAFVFLRAMDLTIYWLSAYATGSESPAPWGSLFVWSTLGSLVLQYIVACIILALLYRYHETVAAWIAVLVIGALGLSEMLI